MSHANALKVAVASFRSGGKRARIGQCKYCRRASINAPRSQWALSGKIAIGIISKKSPPLPRHTCGPEGWR
eukprot:10678093-Alexandrium_andersonii.AAC.1